VAVAGNNVQMSDVQIVCIDRRPKCFYYRPWSFDHGLFYFPNFLAFQ